MVGICLEFCVAWNAWDLLVIQCCLECLELAWDSGLLEMLGMCLEFKIAWNALY